MVASFADACAIDLLDERGSLKRAADARNPTAAAADQLSEPGPDETLLAEHVASFGNRAVVAVGGDRHHRTTAFLNTACGADRSRTCARAADPGASKPTLRAGRIVLTIEALSKRAALSIDNATLYEHERKSTHAPAGLAPRALSAPRAMTSPRATAPAGEDSTSVATSTTYLPARTSTGSPWSATSWGTAPRPQQEPA